MKKYSQFKLSTDTYKPLVIHPDPFSIHIGRAVNLFISSKPSSEHSSFHWFEPCPLHNIKPIQTLSCNHSLHWPNWGSPEKTKLYIQWMPHYILVHFFYVQIHLDVSKITCLRLIFYNIMLQDKQNA